MEQQINVSLYLYNQFKKKRTECSDIFQNGSFSLLLAGSMREFSLLFIVGTLTPGGQSDNIVGAPWLGPPKVFHIYNCSHWGSSNSLITILIFVPWNSFLPWFLLVSLCSSKQHLSVSPVCLKLVAAVWAVSYPLQGELLIFQSVQLFTSC